MKLNFLNLFSTITQTNLNLRYEIQNGNLINMILSTSIINQIQILTFLLTSCS